MIFTLFLSKPPTKPYNSPSTTHTTTGGHRCLPPNHHHNERNILIGAESSESTSRIQWRKISQSILS
ncbi:hypothetical protein HKD37_04G010588 [Glycine soja]